MSCPSCGTVNAVVKTIIRRGELKTVCDFCAQNLTRPNELAAQHRRDYQRREYERDITQPFERGYVKARGIDAAREKGWSDAAIRKYG